jgi:hypothetical protein
MGDDSKHLVLRRQKPDLRTSIVSCVTNSSFYCLFSVNNCPVDSENENVGCLACLTAYQLLSVSKLDA